MAVVGQRNYICYLYFGKRKNSSDNVPVVLSQCLHRLRPARSRLRHNKLNVLRLKSSLVDLLIIIAIVIVSSGSSASQSSSAGRERARVLCLEVHGSLLLGVVT